MLKVGIIGCGDMGGQHAAAWSVAEQTELVAVSDVDAQRRQKMSDQYKAEAVERWQDMLSNYDLDIVSICTPACFHHDLTIAAAQHGCHVLCEKPMAMTLEEADSMLAATEAAGVCLGIAHQYHWQEVYASIGEQIKALGTPLHIRFQDFREVRPKTAMHSSKLSGGPIQDMTGHWFDLCHRFTQAKALSVRASGHTFGAGKDRLAAVEDLAPDTAEIQVQFEHGHVCSVGISWGLPENTPVYGDTTVVGPMGLLRTDGTTVIRHDRTGSHTHCPVADRPAHQALIADFITAINTKRSPTVDGHAGRAALQISLAALESIRSGNDVTL